MKILSFVIPAYNSQQFLKKCLDSMIVPSLLEKLEIIVVNDGSTDRTPEIAREYSVRYPAAVRLISQENKGHGGALNTGCAAATGKYLKVIDADDWIASENLESFLSFLEVCSSDVVLTHYQTIDITTGEVKNWKTYPGAFGKEYTFGQILTEWKNFDRCLTFHGITYNRAFYQKNCVKLLEHIFYEDHQYATYPCCLARTIVPVDLFLYVYRIGDVTQSVSLQNQCSRLGHTQAVLNAMMDGFTSLPEGDGKRFAAMKIHTLLMSYLSTTLLAYPDRAKGRSLAGQMMRLWSHTAPSAVTLTRKKYRIFLLMNLLHLRHQTWTRFLNSGLYNRLRGNHSFK